MARVREEVGGEDALSARAEFPLKPVQETMAERNCYGLTKMPISHHPPPIREERYRRVRNERLKLSLGKRKR